MLKGFYARGFARAAAGLFVCALGTYLSIQVNVGLAPWDAFSTGVSGVASCSYGTVVVVTGFAVLLMAIALKEKIGIGTLLDIAIVGKTVIFISGWALCRSSRTCSRGFSCCPPPRLSSAWVSGCT